MSVRSNGENGSSLSKNNNSNSMGPNDAAQSMMMMRRSDGLPTDEEVIGQVLADIAIQKNLQKRQQEDRNASKAARSGVSTTRDGNNDFSNSSLNNHSDPAATAAAVLSNSSSSSSSFSSASLIQYDSRQQQQQPSLSSLKQQQQHAQSMKKSQSQRRGEGGGVDIAADSSSSSFSGNLSVHKPLDAVLHRYAPSLKLLFNSVAFSQNKRGASDSFGDYEKRALSVNKAELMRCCRVLGLTGPRSLLTKTDVENVFSEMLRMPRHQGRLTLDEAAFIEALARVALISTSHPPLSTIYPSDGDRVDFVFQRAGLSNHIEVAKRLRNHEFHFGGGFGSSGNSISPVVLKEAASSSSLVSIGGASGNGASVGTGMYGGSSSTMSSVISTDPFLGSSGGGGVGSGDIHRVRDSHSHRFLAPPTPEEELIKRRDIRIAAARADRSTAVIAQAMSSSSSSSSSHQLIAEGSPSSSFSYTHSSRTVGSTGKRSGDLSSSNHMDESKKSSASSTLSSSFYNNQSLPSQFIGSNTSFLQNLGLPSPRFNEELEKSLLPSLVDETPLLAALDAFLSSC